MTTVCPVTGHSVVVVGAGPAGLGAAARLQARWHVKCWSSIDPSRRLGLADPLRQLPAAHHPVAVRPAGHGHSADLRTLGRPRRLRCLSRTVCPPIRHQAAVRRSNCRGSEPMTMTVGALTSDGSMRAQRVVLATGACTEPRIPNWPGRRHFKPPLIHSSQYRNPSAYRGKRVLVVGSGNSASEIADDLAGARDVTVEMAVRTPPTILRRDTHGVPTQPVGIALRYAPAGIVNPLGCRPMSHHDSRSVRVRALPTESSLLAVSTQRHRARVGPWLCRRRAKQVR